MASVVALGDPREVDGFALAGARVVVATDDEILATWLALDDDVGLVILSRRAAQILGDRLADHPDVLTAVLP